ISCARGADYGRAVLAYRFGAPRLRDSFDFRSDAAAQTVALVNERRLTRRCSGRRIERLASREGGVYIAKVERKVAAPLSARSLYGLASDLPTVRRFRSRSPMTR